jgi:hypothetical protein
MHAVGRRPTGFQGKTIMLPPELWDRVEGFRVEEHLSSVAEAMRVLLFRAFAGEPLPPKGQPRQKRR